MFEREIKQFKKQFVVVQKNLSKPIGIFDVWHQRLNQNFPLYNNWHKTYYFANAVHWSFFISFIGLLFYIQLYVIMPRVRAVAAEITISNMAVSDMPASVSGGLLSSVVHNNKLYAASNQGYLYEWNDSGVLTQKTSSSTVGYITSLITNGSTLYGGNSTDGILLQWNGTNDWILVASGPEDSNEIHAMAFYNGEIYGGSGWGGSLYKWNGTNAWTQVAPQLDTYRNIDGLVVFNSELYGTASGGDTGGSLLKWNGTTAWESKAAGSMGNIEVYNDGSGSAIYGVTYAGALYKWNGVDTWDLKAPTLNSEGMNGLKVYNGELYAGTSAWSSSFGGKLYKWNGVDAWTEVAPQLGGEYQFFYNSLAVYNSGLYGATGPTGKLYKWNDVDAWTIMAPRVVISYHASTSAGAIDSCGMTGYKTTVWGYNATSTAWKPLCTIPTTNYGVCNAQLTSGTASDGSWQVVGHGLTSSGGSGECEDPFRDIVAANGVTMTYGWDGDTEDFYCYFSDNTQTGGCGSGPADPTGTITPTCVAPDCPGPSWAYGSGGGAVDVDPPYLSGRNPTASSTSNLIDTTVVLHIQDAGDGVFATSTQITLTISTEITIFSGEGSNPYVSDIGTMTQTGTSADYTYTFVPNSNFTTSAYFIQYKIAVKKRASRINLKTRFLYIILMMIKIKFY